MDGEERRRVAPGFVDPREVPFVRVASRGELPHLHKPGCTYFLTFRLLDAVTAGVAPHEDTEDLEMIASTNEPPITLGSCVLRGRAALVIVCEALVFFHGRRYWLHEWCVMPNRVHVVVTPLGRHALSEIMHSWKSFTANRVNRTLGRRGSLWERETFDHACRTVEHVAFFSRYVRENPVKAELCGFAGEWMGGSAFVRGLPRVRGEEMRFWLETAGRRG